MLAVMTALCAGLYRPVGTQPFELVVGQDGRTWLRTSATFVVPPEDLVIAWDLASSGVDAAAARLSVLPTGARVSVKWRQQEGELVRWRLASDQRVEVQACLSAPVKELKVEREHLVQLREEGLTWQCRVKLSGWKGRPTEAVPVRLPEGQTTVALQPEQTVTAPVWEESSVACRVVLRWDSRSGGETATKTVVVDRQDGKAFARRSLPGGRLTLTAVGKEFAQDFGGAQPGVPVELAAGPEDSVRVQRTRAVSTQVNAKSDVHRRLAAFDEKIEYEYAVINASTQDVVLEVVEHPKRGWRVEEATHRWQRRDADTLIVEAPLAARAKDTLRLIVIRANQTPE